MRLNRRRSPSERPQAQPKAARVDPRKGLAFGSKESVCTLASNGAEAPEKPRPHVLSAAIRSLRPGNRCDPGLASVRGRDWPAPETRAFKSCPSNSTTRNSYCSEAQRSATIIAWLRRQVRSAPRPKGRSQASRSWDREGDQGEGGSADLAA